MAKQPQDGPATVFVQDPKVTDLFTCTDGDYFGFVLVAGWPTDLPRAIAQPYSEFLKHVKQCFDEADLISASDNDLPPPVYLYPSRHLHVTVATFAPSEKRGGDNSQIPQQDYATFQKKYQALAEAASQRPDWPRQTSIQLKLQSVQLGAKAGILLWEDTSGTIEKMRDCIRQQAAAENTSIWGIPGIIHSTFLRYAQVPKTSGEVAQERFQSQVIPMATKIFHQPIKVTSAKLVCESTPYMHIPDDDDHTFLTINLGTKEE